MKSDRAELGSQNYPEILRHIHNPPKQLYIAGSLPKAKHWVAVVGSRRATSYGRDVAYEVASQLARRGVVIVSGLALGIDTVAHQAAVDAGGRTVAVLGGGFHQLYPASNRKLAEAISESHGAVISEHPPETPPLRQYFPARNRIIAGLAQITIVVEAALSSGSLITATFALEGGREVMAVPGNINQPASAGCNNLIKLGAVPLTSVGDVEQLLGIETEKVTLKLPDDPVWADVYQAILSGIQDSEDIMRALKLDAAQLSEALTNLELSGYIRSLGAGKWAASSTQ